MKPYYYLVGIVVIFIAMASCNFELEDTSKKILAAEYGVRWPWPAYSYAYLDCSPRMRGDMVTIKLGSTVYGLNGPAMEIYPDARSRMKLNQFGTPDTRAAFTLISRGRQICRDIEEGRS